MAQRLSSFSRLDVICRAATLTTHTLFQPQGARLRDIRFFVQLFGNWLEHAVGEDSYEVRSMQLSRFLKKLVAAGLMRELVRKKTPFYLLTRAGVVELLRDIVSQPLYRRPNLLLFVRYFFTNYREHILQLVSQEGGQFPPALRLEVEALLDTSRLMARQRELAEREHQKLKLRLEDSVAMGNMAIAGFKAGKSQEQIALEVEKKYSYELNSQKPLRELLAFFPKEQATWELTEGALERARDLWVPMNQLWEAYASLLNELSPARNQKPDRKL